MTVVLDLWKFRQLLYFLTLKEIKTRYKQTFLGLLWAILTPLSQALIFDLIFGVFLRVPSTSNPPYLIVIFSGFVFWNFFSLSVSTAIFALTSNYSLVTKASFPKEILIFSAVLGRIPDLLASFVVLLIFFFIYRISISAQIFWLLPITLLEILLAIGVSLFFAATNVYFRDIAAITPLFLTAWFYLTPVVYPLTSVPAAFQSLFKMNPMVGIIDSIHRSILLGQGPDYLNIGLSVTVTVLILSISYFIFKRLEKGFADII